MATRRRLEEVGPRARVLAALVGALLVCLGLSVLLLSVDPVDAADRDCADFSNQQQAQQFFENHNPSQDPHRLDADGDGIACESNPCPCMKPGGGDGGGDGGGGHKPRPNNKTRARVGSVTDGDTIKAQVKGKRRSVRLIGIDTPEVFGGKECGGPEASESMKRLLDHGDRITLIRDRSQDNRDRYGRLLRYVEHNRRDVGHKQIARGWAEVYVFERRFKRVRKYRRAQQQARKRDRGVWEMCGGRF